MSAARRGMGWRHNWDQLLQLSPAHFDLEAASRWLDTQAGNNTPNRRDG